MSEKQPTMLEKVQNVAMALDHFFEEYPIKGRAYHKVSLFVATQLEEVITELATSEEELNRAELKEGTVE